jgi:hypothetical protein
MSLARAADFGRSVASSRDELQTPNSKTNCCFDNLRISVDGYAHSVCICRELTSMGMHFCVAGMPSPNPHSGQSDSRGHANRSLCIYSRRFTWYPDVFSFVIRRSSPMAKVASATRALITAQPNNQLLAPCSGGMSLARRFNAGLGELNVLVA